MTPFEEFWREFPRKCGRIKAERAWWKLREQDRIFCMQRLELWKSSIDWRDPLYIPHASTFLNQRRWEDEPIVYARPSDNRTPSPKQVEEAKRDIAEILRRHPELA